MQVRNIWCGFVYKFDNKKYDFDRVVLFVDFALRESIGFTGVLNDFEIKIDSFRCVISLLNMVFSVEFDRSLIFKVLMGF